MLPYAELHAHSAYSFLHGADLPQVLVRRAYELGLEAIAVLDYDGMYSAVQTATAARELGMRTVQGTELRLDNHTHLPILARSVAGYYDLCAAVSEFQLAHEEKTETIFGLEELAQYSNGQWMILTGSSRGPVRAALATGKLEAAEREIARLKDLFGSDRVLIETTVTTPEEEDELVHVLADMARRTRTRLVATTAARSASSRSVLRAHVVRAIQLGGTLSEVEPYLEAYPPILRSAEEMQRIHRHYPEAVEEAAVVADECSFDLRLIAPDLPPCQTPPGYTEETWLRECAYRGARERYGTREEYPKAWEIIDRELAIIIRLGFAGYFLIVKEIVDYCHEERILCQGRGSAANSAVCYALGITAVDAVRHRMLFERFLSPDRSGPPDIDIDIESDRRELVIQHIYTKYGRRYAAQVANVISYRPKSAIRDVAKAFGYPEELARQWGKGISRVPADPRVMSMAASLQHLPRHLGIHPGGIVLTRQPVSHLCPVQWGTKKGRTVLQWDKDDCAEAGFVKFDLLGLGMLTALRKMFDSLAARGIGAPDGKPYDLYNLPQDDPLVYNLLCAADTVGVFQVESRAQMNTLPRLQPRCFYDLVVEVALIRPGPIQGQAVNPYLRRRRGREKVTYPHPLLKPALEKTLGVPLFQEQLMQIATDAAGFTASQADKLRKAMGSKRSDERMKQLRPQLFAGLAKNGITGSAAEEIVDSLNAFADFGFPESHAFSFAYIVYASAWMKVHYPEDFYAAILSSQPMGFYSSASLVEDARRHGICVGCVSVLYSQVETAVEKHDDGGLRQKVKPPVQPDPTLCIRLGLNTVKGLDHSACQRIVDARRKRQYSSLADLGARARLTTGDLEKLALAGALDDLVSSRREGMWSAPLVAQQSGEQMTLPGIEWPAPADFPSLTAVEEIQTDYAMTGLSVQRHPMELVRRTLGAKVKTCDEVPLVERGRRIRVAGIITHRQRPHTAAGTVFLSLEDETGLANIICQKNVWKRFRPIAMTASAIIVRGVVETEDGSHAIVADKLELCQVPVSSRSRDFR
ncbi:MAG: error-prone DNA polymerase [Actinomycetaceae bacterium]|nr:error-prone DNA polymerase [Actinomycetaceae bacterium]